MLDMGKKIILLVALACVAAACENTAFGRCEIDCQGDEEILARAGAVRLGPEEVRAHVAGKTEQWVRGGAYYEESGRLEVKWRKVKSETVWEVGADGSLCYQIDAWGRRCHFYMKKENEVYMLDEGRNIGVRAMYDGNRLKNIKGYAPAAD